MLYEVITSMKDSKVEVFLSSIYEPLYRYISMFANKNDIEDIIQKSMLAFVSKYNYEEIENPKALITKISRNFVKQNYRKRSYEDQAMSMYCTINNEDVITSYSIHYTKLYDTRSDDHALSERLREPKLKVDVWPRFRKIRNDESRPSDRI